MLELIRTDVVKVKLKEIDESLTLVKENLPSAFDEFTDLGLMKDGIYKRIEFCIESVLDACAILNADLELGIPKSEEDIVENLVKAKILSEEMGRTIKRMKGFRNFLVHRYGAIDDEIAYKNIQTGFKDFDTFKQEINTFLKENTTR